MERWVAVAALLAAENGWLRAGACKHNGLIV